MSLFTALRENGLLFGWLARSLIGAFVLVVSPIGHTADVYNMEPSDSFVTFSVKHLGLSSVKGRFNEVEGFIVVNNGVITEAGVTIQVKSVDTGVQERDDRLRSSDFFDVSNYPTITFQTKHITKNRVYGKRHNLWDGGVTVVGHLTMHGVTRGVAIHRETEWTSQGPLGRHEDWARSQDPSKTKRLWNYVSSAT